LKFAVDNFYANTMSISKNLKISLAVLIAILLIAPWSFDIGVVPITMQTLIIFIGASLLHWRSAIIVLLAYLAIGAVGLPVFGGHSFGIAKLYGPTAGFLWGFVLCAAYIAWEANRKEFHFYRAIQVFTLAHLILLLPGFFILDQQMPNADLWGTLVKLLPGLLIKSILGGIIAAQIHKLVHPQKKIL